MWVGTGRFDGTHPDGYFRISIFDLRSLLCELGQLCVKRSVAARGVRRGEIANRKSKFENSLQVLMQIPDDLVPIQIHPRFFAECVVSAWNRGLAVFDLVAAEGTHGLA